MKVDKASKSSLWLFASGLIIIGLGVYLWLNPSEAVLALALYIGIVLIISGLGYLVAFFNKKYSWYLAQGLLNVLVGIIFVTNLSTIALSLPIMVAFWSLFVGALQISSAYHSKTNSGSWLLTFLSGVLGIIFAFLIISNPFIGKIAITIVIGIYMIFYGVLGIADCALSRLNSKK